MKFKKGISTIVGLTKKVLSPFSDIIERIKRFIFFTLLGVAFNKFMNWLDDKENRRKFKNITDFLIDHWPAIVGLYILFGTSFGKLVRGLVKGIVRTVIALTMNIPRILSFIKKNKKLSLLGIGVASLASGYVSREVGNIFSSDKTSDEGLQPSSNSDLEQAKRTSEQAKETKVPTFNFGGIIPKMPSFNFGGMIPSIPEIPTFSMGGMDFQSGIPISGAGPDDTLIAAKTGEAILTEKDQVDLSKRYVDKKTGQPLNVPQYLSGRKPGYVNMSNLRFNGGRYFGGGTIPKFNTGGMIGKGNISKTPGRKFNPLESINGNAQQSGGLRLSSMPGGGLVENARNWFGNLFNFNRPPKSNPRRSSKPKILQDYQTPEAQALLSTIRAAEHYRGSNPYQAIYGGGNIPSLTQMTVKEVIDMGNTGNLPARFGGKSAGYGSGSAATGAYQFMPFTLQDLIRRRVVKPDQIMTPDLQDKLGWELARNRGINLQSLRKTGLNQPLMDMMAPEWASFPYSPSGGKSYYGQPVKGSDFLRQMYLESLRQNKIPKKQGGGLIGEGTGMNIPGETADRQLMTVAVQPKESKFIFTKQATERGAVDIANYVQAKLDPNSEAAKKGYRSITPYNTMGSGGMGGVITLPPITQSSSGNRARASGYGGGSQVPNFSVTCPNNDRALNASIYGLIESTV